MNKMNNNEKIISYGGNRLTRPHMVIPPPTNSAKYTTEPIQPI